MDAVQLAKQWGYIIVSMTMYFICKSKNGADPKPAILIAKTNMRSQNHPPSHIVEPFASHLRAETHWFQMSVWFSGGAPQKRMVKKENGCLWKFISSKVSSGSGWCFCKRHNNTSLTGPMANIGQLAANRRMANTRSVDTNQITGYMGTHHHISSQSPLIYRILDGFPCFPVESPY